MSIEFDGPRPPLEKEIPELLAFLKHSLRPEKPWDFKTEYPLVFQPSNIHNLRIIKKGDEVLSHAAVKPLLVKAPFGLVKVAEIGSVVTNENYRNQGLSGQNMKACLETAYLMGCEIAILWTNLYDFYRKLGFELAGSEIHLQITERFQPPLWPGLRIVTGSQIDAQALLRLFSRHRVNSLRKESDIVSHMKIPNSRIYTCWDENGHLSAYAVEGKGADLDGYIHEWAGGVKALAHLLSHIRSEQGRDLVLLGPRHSENLIRQFEKFGAKRTDGYLGMIKLLHTDRFFDKVLQYGRHQGVDNMILHRDERTFHIGIQGDSLRTSDETDLVKILFGPNRPTEFAAWKPETSALLDKVFPLPFWIWGWDSV